MMPHSLILAAALLAAGVPTPAAAQEEYAPYDEDREEVQEEEREETEDIDPDESAGPWRCCNVMFGLGARTAEEVDGVVASFEIDATDPKWPVSVLVAMSFADLDAPAGTGPYWNTVSVFGIGGGIRKRWRENATFRPYLSIGAKVYYASASLCEDWDCSDELDETFTIGPFADGGFEFGLSEDWSIGARARFTVADVALMGTELDLDGLSGEVVLGWQF